MSLTSPIYSMLSFFLSIVHNLFERGYLVFDTVIYYVINIFMMILIFTDFLVETMNKMMHNYNILVCSFRHKMYNNIN